MFTAAWLFLKGLPAWVWVALALLAGGWYYGHTRYEAGELAVQTKWDESVARGKAEVERIKAEAGKVTIRVETKTVEKIVTIREKGRVIYKDREIFVPADSGMLPGGFRVYFDAATKNTVPDATSIANAPPVSVTDVADTYAHNAEQCHVAYATVAGWQEWAAEQQKVNP